MTRESTIIRVDEETKAYLEMYKEELGLKSFNSVMRYLIGFYFIKKAFEEV